MKFISKKYLCRSDIKKSLARPAQTLNFKINLCRSDIKNKSLVRFETNLISKLKPCKADIKNKVGYKKLNHNK